MPERQLMSDNEVNDGIRNIESWVIGGINKEAIEFAEGFGKRLAKLKERGKDEFLTTTQIRNVFGEVRRIQMNQKREYNDSPVLLLLPKLAYAAKRANRKAVLDLSNVLSNGIRAITDATTEVEKLKRFENFTNFFEAVLAYHKAADGK